MYEPEVCVTEFLHEEKAAPTSMLAEHLKNSGCKHSEVVNSELQL